MERINLSRPPEENIILYSDFIVDDLIPKQIQVMPEIHSRAVCYIFKAVQNSTQTVKSIGCLFLIEDSDLVIDRNGNSYFSLEVRGVDERELVDNDEIEYDENNLYMFNTTEFKYNMKNYYENTAHMKIDADNHFYKLGLKFSREVYVKFNLFLNNMDNMIPFSSNVLLSRKYSSMRFYDVNHSRNNANTYDESKGIVFSHYVCGAGPTEFKFNVLSSKIKDKTLRSFYPLQSFMDLYGDDPIIMDIIEESKTSRLLLLDHYNSITGKFERVDVIRYSGDMLKNKTNLIHPEKIYEDNSSGKIIL